MSLTESRVAINTDAGYAARRLFPSHKAPRGEDRVPRPGLQRCSGPAPLCTVPPSSPKPESGEGEIAANPSSGARRKNGEVQGRGTGRRE